MNRYLSIWIVSAALLVGCSSTQPNPVPTEASASVASSAAKGADLAELRASFLAETDPEALAILRFWYEEWDEDMRDGGRGRYNDKWFPHGPKGAAGSAKVDAEIRELFMGTFEVAEARELDWDIENNPFENLAYIILMDQMSRNMFRGQPRAYANDALALDAAGINLKKKFYEFYFTGYQKLFVVYPFMHDETLASQQGSLEILKAINEDEEHRYEFLNAMDKGVEHYQMIFMFGRFPHRNERLGRADTENEAAYLEKKGTPGFVDGSKW